MDSRTDKKTPEDLSVCRKSDTAEHFRFSDEGEPCDDARSANFIDDLTPVKENVSMEKTSLTIPGISCAHCVMTIKNELSEIEGVKNVEGRAETKNIVVTWESPATLEKIRKTLDDINYPAT